MNNGESKAVERQRKFEAMRQQTAHDDNLVKIFDGISSALVLLMVNLLRLVAYCGAAMVCAQKAARRANAALERTDNIEIHLNLKKPLDENQP